MPHNGTIPSPYGERFIERINDDLDTPGALAVLWEMVNDRHVASENVRAGLVAFNRVLGLKLDEPDDLALTLSRKEHGASVTMDAVPQRVKDLLAERELARTERRWAEADDFRAAIEKEGFIIEDTSDRPRVVAKY